MLLLRMLRPKTLRAWKHYQEEQDPSQLCDDVFSLLPHSADVHEDKRLMTNSYSLEEGV